MVIVFVGELYNFGKQKMSNANKKCQTQTIITTSEMK